MRYVLLFAIALITVTSCKENTTPANNNTVADLSKKESEPVIEKQPNKIPEKFKEYWYNGTAEVSSYALEQARYGELRDGNAVLIFVTEPFNPKKQVKADRPDKNDVSVLKLNSTKKFNTGVYPYSIMTSTFYPVSNDQHALKVNNSVQEWCGHVFTQLNNRKAFNINSYSYFESEGDQKMTLSKAILENELYNQLRIDPSTLPIGEQTIIPDFSYLRLAHKEIKAYACTATLEQKEVNSVYTLHYPEINRTLAITFTSNFPYTILSWEETYRSGFGANAKSMTTKATLKKTLNIPYWAKNSNQDEILRNELMLD